MASDALRRLSARFSPSHTIFRGDTGDSGDSLEKSRFFRPHDCPHDHARGDKSGTFVPTVPTSENTVGTDKSLKSLDVPTVPAVPTENDKGLTPARSTQTRPQPDEWGLSRYTIRDLARWYVEEADRRRNGIVLDQHALDRDLRKLIADRGVFTEYIMIEFERVMEIVFAPI